MEEKGEKFDIAIDLRPVADDPKSLYVIKEFLKQLEKLKILQVTDFSTNDKNLLVILGLAQPRLHNLRCGKCHQTGYFYQYPTIPGFGYDNIFCSECRG